MQHYRGRELEVCYALLDRDSEFQLANKLMRCEAKDPELIVALDRRESGKAAASKDDFVSLPRPATGQGHRGRWQHKLTGGVGQQAYHC